MKAKHSFISEEIFIINAFNSKQETLLSDFSENIDNHIEIIEVERWYQSSADDEGELSTVQVEHIEGITKEEYNIRELFTETMPIYQRQAMLITLWSAFESEMEKMCIHYSSINNVNYKLPNKPKHESKLTHLVNQLKKVNIPITPSENFTKSFNRPNLRLNPPSLDG